MSYDQAQSHLFAVREAHADFKKMLEPINRELIERAGTYSVSASNSIFRIMNLLKHARSISQTIHHEMESAIHGMRDLSLEDQARLMRLNPGLEIVQVHNLTMNS